MVAGEIPVIPDLSKAERDRYVAAMRERPRPQARRNNQPTVQAPSSGPCPFCGVPGFKGCDHFLPLGPRPVNEFRGKR